MQAVIDDLWELYHEYPESKEKDLILSMISELEERRGLINDIELEIYTYKRLEKQAKDLYEKRYLDRDIRWLSTIVEEHYGEMVDELKARKERLWKF